jgi:hypothetical protein
MIVRFVWRGWWGRGRGKGMGVGVCLAVVLGGYLGGTVGICFEGGGGYGYVGGVREGFG